MRAKDRADAEVNIAGKELKTFQRNIFLEPFTKTTTTVDKSPHLAIV